MDLPTIDWYAILSSLAKLTVAYLLAMPVAWEREKHARTAGLRTFPLVAVASCGYMLIAAAVFTGSADAQSRLVQGLMTGIGFVGGGAILKHGGNVHGTATAASIWTTGAIGTAVAFGRFEIAIVLSVVNYLTLRLLTPLKRSLDDQDDRPQSAKSGQG